MKVVINACFGGFSVSFEAAEHMAAAGSEWAKREVAEYEKELRDFAAYKNSGKMPEGRSDFERSIWDINIKYNSLPRFYGYDCKRDDPQLVAAVEALGAKANGECAMLKVVEIPDGVDYTISEYDGNEHIAEAHRTWA